jgi:hypothetical protein
MSIFSACLVLIVVAFSTTAEAKLYKWVDDKGVTHYGEVIPPEYANKSNVLLSDKGLLIKRTEEINNKERRAKNVLTMKPSLNKAAKIRRCRTLSATRRKLTWLAIATCIK